LVGKDVFWFEKFISAIGKLKFIDAIILGFCPFEPDDQNLFLPFYIWEKQ